MIKQKVVFLILCFTTAGICLFDKAFVKIRFGPFFVADAAFLACILLVILSRNRLEVKKLLFVLWVPFLFFCVGFIRCAVDLFIQRNSLSDPLFFRVAQHSIIWVYPFIWSAIGAWVFFFNRRWSDRWLLFVFIVSLFCSAINWLGSSAIQIPGNLSVGPLVCLAAIWCLHEIIQPTHTLQKRVFLLIGTCATLMLSFTPIWRGWGVSVQRTTFVLMIAMTIVIPWLLKTLEEKALLCLKMTLFLWLIMVMGIMILNTYPHPRQSFKTNLRNPHPCQSFKTNLLKMSQHGEDVPTTPEGPKFQFRTRGYMWKCAIADWLKAPIFGMGFTKEMPSFFLPGVVNTGGFEFPNSPPVSGPHNSYLTILARMGIVGLLVFLFLAVRLIRSAIHVLRDAPLPLSSVIMLILLFNGAVYAFFNVGFESPHHCIIMWITAGILLARTYHETNPSRS